jgi:4-aminobutyrate aminotransferase-like enzyme
MGLSVTDLTPVATASVRTSWRRILTPIPVPQSIPLIQRLRRVEPQSMAGMPPVLWHEAEGFLVRDPYGNQWIDLTSGIVAANVGHAHRRIRAAIREALERRLLLSYAFPTEARAELLSKLVDLSPYDDGKAILFSAGTEVTECAMMLMRRHGQRLAPDKVGILSFAGGYHGRTLAAALAGGKPAPDDWIARERVGHHQVPFPFCPRCPWGRGGYNECGGWCFERCLESLRERGVGPGDLAGIIGEALPGWATWPLPPDFAAAMAAWAAKHGVLIAFDEVQCGCGRTGRLFGFEHAGVTPDLIAMGKGLTSSVPASALLGRRELVDQPDPGDMSSTHGGNPVCAAAALASLEALEDEGLTEASARTGELALRALQNLEAELPGRVLSVHGRGLFISIHFCDPANGDPDADFADAVAREAVRRGVMMFPTGRGFLKFVPPLCIHPEAALEAAEVIRACCVDLDAAERESTDSGRGAG